MPQRIVECIATLKLVGYHRRTATPANKNTKNQMVLSPLIILLKRSIFNPPSF